MRIGERVQPQVLLGAVSPRPVANLRASGSPARDTSQLLCLARRRKDIRCLRRDRRERARSPRDPALLDGEAPQDGHLRRRPVAVLQAVLGHPLAEQVALRLACSREHAGEVARVGKGRGRRVLDGVHEDDVGREDVADLDDDLLLPEHDHVGAIRRAELERDPVEDLWAEGPAVVGRGAQGPRQLGAVGVEGAGQRDGSEVCRRRGDRHGGGVGPVDANALSARRARGRRRVSPGGSPGPVRRLSGSCGRGSPSSRARRGRGAARPRAPCGRGATWRRRYPQSRGTARRGGAARAGRRLARR